MRRGFAIFVFCLAWAHSVFAVVAPIPVAPADINSDSSHVFSVSTNAIQGGVAFHISYSPKSADAETNFSAPGTGICIVKNHGTEYEDLKPGIPIAVKTQQHACTADFVVSHKLLKNPDVYFMFIVSPPPIGTLPDGRPLYPPGETRFLFRLRDFAQ